MDSLHAIGFYVSAALSLVGGLALAFLPSRGQRGVAMGLVGVGLAGVYTSLSAGFAALVTLGCYAGIALLVGRPDYRAVVVDMDGRWRQAGAIGAALLLAALAYVAYSGTFAHGTFYGGSIGAVAMGRLLFTHDALATEAVAGIVLAALAGAAVIWRRERAREERARDLPVKEQRADLRARRGGEPR